MAEKVEKKAEEKPGASASAAARPPAAKSEEANPGKSGLLKSTPVLLGVVMFLEAAALFAGFKFLNVSPVSAKGADLVGGEATESTSGHGASRSEGHGAPASAKANPKKLAELKVVEFKAPNKQSGRSYLYDVSIFLATKGELKEKLEATIADRDALIKDRIRTIIAQSDPEKLGGGEPGLETFRRQVKYQLEEILGEGTIEEVLVPRCIQYRTDY